MNGIRLVVYPERSLLPGCASLVYDHSLLREDGYRFLVAAPPF